LIGPVLIVRGPFGHYDNPVLVAATCLGSQGTRPAGNTAADTELPGGLRRLRVFRERIGRDLSEEGYTERLLARVSHRHGDRSTGEVSRCHQIVLTAFPAERHLEHRTLGSVGIDECAARRPELNVDSLQGPQKQVEPGG